MEKIEIHLAHGELLNIKHILERNIEENRQYLLNLLNNEYPKEIDWDEILKWVNVARDYKRDCYMLATLWNESLK